jgi:hypothetical protein
MVPGIFLGGPVEYMIGPVKCGSKLALDQKKSGNFALPLMSYYKMCCGRLFDHEVHH